MKIYILVVGYDDSFYDAYLHREDAEKMASNLGYDMWEIREVTL